MFFVTFRIRCNHQSRIEIIQTLQGYARKAKELKGCTDVHVYNDTEDENAFFLIEEWLDHRDLEEHVASDLFAALRGSKELLAKPPEIRFMAEDK